MYFIGLSFKKWSFFFSSHFIFHRLFWRGHWTPFVKIQIKHSNSDQSTTNTSKKVAKFQGGTFMLISGELYFEKDITGHYSASILLSGGNPFMLSGFGPHFDKSVSQNYTTLNECLIPLMEFLRNSISTYIIQEDSKTQV